MFAPGLVEIDGHHHVVTPAFDPADHSRAENAMGNGLPFVERHVLHDIIDPARVLGRSLRLWLAAAPLVRMDRPRWGRAPAACCRLASRLCAASAEQAAGHRFGESAA